MDAKPAAVWMVKHQQSRSLTGKDCSLLLPAKSSRGGSHLTHLPCASHLAPNDLRMQPVILKTWSVEFLWLKIWSGETSQTSTSLFHSINQISGAGGLLSNNPTHSFTFYFTVFASNLVRKQHISHNPSTHLSLLLLVNMFADANNIELDNFCPKYQK